MVWLKEIAKKQTLSAPDKTNVAKLNALAPKRFYIWRLETPNDKIGPCENQSHTALKYGLKVAHLNDVLHKKQKQTKGYGAAFIDE